MKCILFMLIAFTFACGSSSEKSGGGGTGGTGAGGGTGGADAGIDAGATFPDCKGDWPAQWVTKEQEVVAAVNAARAKGGVCNGVTFPPVPTLTTDSILTQVARCFLRDQDNAGSNALVGSTADVALRDQALALNYAGQLLGYAGDIVVASADEVVAGMLGNANQCPVIFDPKATTGAMGYLADPNGDVPQRWAGFVAVGPGVVLPTWVASPGPGRKVEYAGVNLAGADFGTVVPGVYNQDYTYPTPDEIDYFVAKGMNAFRFPFLWERMQRTLNGDLDAAELNRLTSIVSHATGAGAMALLDPHNYARRGGAIIGSDTVPDAAFADFWSKLANVFKSDQHVVFGLMNEPHDLGVGGTARWLTSANTAISAIRAASATNLILVPGDHWTGAWSWTQTFDGTSNAAVMTGVVDSANHFAFEVHQYLDADSSGSGTDCVSSKIGVDRVTAFTTWARGAGVRAFLGEFGSPATNTCFYAVDNLLGYVSDNADVWLGWTCWAAGPWWGDYSLSVEPMNGTDTPQMAVLERYLTPP